MGLSRRPRFEFDAEQNQMAATQNSNKIMTNLENVGCDISHGLNRFLNKDSGQVAVPPLRGKFVYVQHKQI